MIPQAQAELRELMTFIDQMATDYKRDRFAGWQDFVRPVRQWFTSQRLQQIDAVVMGWQEMASYENQQTVIHLTAALISLLSMPAYQALTPAQQNLALWIVLYHDVGKKANDHKRDLTHGFRSASFCGQGLVRNGFVSDVDAEQLQQWATFTETATLFDDALQEDIQDNRKLDKIMAGIDTLFGGRTSPAGLILCGVLFHMSLNVVDDFPQAAPLTDEQIRAHLAPEVMPLLEVMMITDNLAWSLFDRGRIEAEHQQAHREFRRVRAIIHDSQ